ncbi:aminotransferase [Chelatococcus composti]|uniref:aspartate transaminase n=1 Tax=Chelatococcus composti TaxID=1743235 RepID=A0A841KCV5_9HYPH|nr:aspartate/methionine/tyrosine aminotransferase [Chelatococcus composti]GGG29179.1 aminotransferase [Chelatococcus composti]
MNDLSLLSSLRREAREAPASGIVDVVNHGRTRPGLIPLWVGEGDMPTPAFIAEAATRSLAAGETFYTWQRGIPELREALARYISRLYGKPYAAERFYVTGSGMQALQIAVRMLVGSGDEVVLPTPAWPNFEAAIGIAGAKAVPVPMQLSNAGWTLDLDRLAGAITPATRVICINSPANPTGWTATREELAAILALARRHGLWIIADEIYGRFVYDGAERAPSFRDVMEDDDRIVFVQTFSKNWAMTGWRVGWLEAPPALGDVIENLIQYATSGVAVFIQRACVAALDHGEGFVAHQIARAKAGRDIVCRGLAATGRVRFAEPAGAFYLFFSVDGEDDTRRLAIRLVDEANVGLAPGSAFGAGGERFLRLCFARKAEDLEEAVARLARALR